MADVLEPIVVALSREFGSLLANAIRTIPDLLIAVILVVLGWVVATLAKRFLLKIFATCNFEKFLKEQEVDKTLGNVVISELLTMIVYYYVIILFLQQAVDKLYLRVITVFMAQVLAYLPVLIGSILLVLVAAMVGEFFKRRILMLGEKDQGLQMVARGAKFIIVYIGIVMGLDKVGFNTTILNNLLLNLSTAVFYGLALAFGIAFGFGGQDSAKDWIKTLRARFRV